MVIRQPTHTIQETNDNKHVDVVRKGHSDIHDELKSGCEHNYIAPPDSTKQTIVINIINPMKKTYIKFKEKVS